jgi:hypothetical protein
MLARAQRSVGACPAEAPPAVRATLERLSTSRDRDALSDLLTMGLYIADSSVVTKALDVALQPTATPEARAISLLLAIVELNDRTTFDPEIAWATEYVGCQTLVLDHSLRGAGATTLGGASWEELQQAVTRLRADTNTPVQIRNVLPCAERRLRGE